MAIQRFGTSVNLANYNTMAEALAAFAPAGSAPVVAINALPFTRTVTATGSISLSGTATNTPTTITWSASPSGSSGSFTPAASWSGTVSISPDASGEGIETITVTATNAFGSGTANVTVGFYVTGAHSIFHAQNIDGSYNSTLANNDASATWENLGSSGLDVTQGTAGSRPTYKTAVVGGQPTVSFDGGDTLADAAANAANWNFITKSATATTETVYRTLTDTAKFQAAYTIYSAAVGGSYHGMDWRASSNRIWAQAHNATTFGGGGATNSALANQFQLSQAIKNTADATDHVVYIDGASFVSITTAGNTNATDHLKIGGRTDTPFVILTGDIWRIMFYSTQLSTDQRQINEAVDEWALGGTFPITP